MASVAPEKDDFLYSALNSGKYSDLEIRCKDLVLKVHRVVVCSRSKVFTAMLDNDCKEAHDGIIDLPDDEPEIVSLMVEFLYSSAYVLSSDKRIQRAVSPANSAKRRKLSKTESARAKKGKGRKKEESSTDESSNEESLITHVKCYIAGDKYAIHSLKEYSRKRYLKSAFIHWNTPSFIESIPLLYENTIELDMDLKARMAAVAHIYRKPLLKNIDYVDMLLECPEFSLALLHQGARGTILERIGYQCEACKDDMECPDCDDEVWYAMDGEDGIERVYCHGCESEVLCSIKVCRNCDGLNTVKRVDRPFDSDE